MRKATSLLFRDPTTFFAKSRTPGTEVFALPAKWKGGRIEKFVNYWKADKDDYSEAFKGKSKAFLLKIGPHWTLFVKCKYHINY